MNFYNARTDIFEYHRCFVDDLREELSDERWSGNFLDYALTCFEQLIEEGIDRGDGRMVRRGVDLLASTIALQCGLNHAESSPTLAALSSWIIEGGSDPACVSAFIKIARGMMRPKHCCGTRPEDRVPLDKYP